MQRRAPPKGRRERLQRSTQAKGCSPRHREIDDNGAKRLQPGSELSAAGAAIAKRRNEPPLGYGNAKEENDNGR